MKEFNIRDSILELLQHRARNKPYTASEKVQRIIARLDYIYDKITDYKKARHDLPVFRIRRTVISDVVTMFGVSLSQAALDYEMVCEYFQIENVGFELQHTLQIALKDLDEDIEAARMLGEFDAVAKLHRARAEYLKLYPKEQSNLSTLPFAQIVMVFDPKLINSSVDMSLDDLYRWSDAVIAKEKRHMSDMLDTMAENVESDELPD